MLTIIKKINITYGLYRCDCGNELQCSINRVNKGWQSGCGCKKKRHGLSGHLLASVWNNMKSRCYNPNNEKFHRNGARGVKVCQEWINDFKAFYDWCIKNGWQEGMEVDKDIKAKKAGKEGFIYSPEWCSIVTGAENSNYRNGSVFITREGETKTIMQWCNEIGLKQSTYYSRIKTGWTIEESLNTPAKKVNRNKNPTRSKIDYKIAEKIRELHKDGGSNVSIAKVFSIDPSTVSTIVNNKSWIK